MKSKKQFLNERDKSNNHADKALQRYYEHQEHLQTKPIKTK
jgi:hypothetical protein